ncbi:MAG: hypothetical protein KHY90_09035 [Clostridium sp.]|nr:hypothetical protein [Clostridium sp.]
MMRYQKIIAVLMTFLVLLNVSACARTGIQDDLQSSSEEVHEEQSEVKEAESVLPNSWKMDQFVIAGFDKDGPGDFGRQVSLSDEEQAELLQLLDIESWESCEGIEHGLSVCLTVADKELQHFLSVQDAGEEGSVILLLDQTSDERWLYRASEQTAKQAEQLAARLRARCDEK